MMYTVDMIKLLPYKIRTQLKKIDWLARFYRKYLMKFPLDDGYSKVIEAQDILLSDMVMSDESVQLSIIVPTFKPDMTLLGQMVESVFNQSYTNWQLVIVDDASRETKLTECLNGLVQDERVAIVQRETNGHISKASNDGLAHAKGDFLVLLDHDDELHPHALKLIAQTIQNNPSVKVIYSDEDKITENGFRTMPHFKPNWNRDLLYSMNYISHLGVYKRELVEKIGGFRQGYEGSQDYDLLLRCVDHCKDSEIVHVPYILYHWRAITGSTALHESEKSYAEIAGSKALEDHVKNKHASVDSGMLANTYKVNWPIPKHLPLVSIIIPTKNARNLVKQCIESIKKNTDYSNYEIVLVDNQSDELKSIQYFELLESSKIIRFVKYDQAFNYSAINNYAVKHAQGDVIILMNNDIEVLNSMWLSEMVSHVSRCDIGCVGAKLYYPNKTIQHAGVILGIGGVAGHSHKHFHKDHPGYFKRLKIVQNVSAVTGACLAVRKSVYNEVGGLNEKSLTVAFNDVDFCLKVNKAGYRNLWTPYAEMIHHESISRGKEDTREKRARFASEVLYMKNTWGDTLLNDTNYSQWLTLLKEDFSIKCSKEL